MTTLASPDELVSAHELSKLLGVSPGLVAQWVRRGILPEPWGSWGDQRAFRLWRWAEIEPWAKRTGRMWPGVLVTEAGCWEWQGLRTRFGHGVFLNTTAHRVAWSLMNGPIPDGLLCCHHCDNPPCINPEHLFLGTHADNMADKNAKGRGWRGGSKSKERRAEEPGRLS